MKRLRGVHAERRRLDARPHSVNAAELYNAPRLVSRESGSGCADADRNAADNPRLLGCPRL
jgi:hypothetical protein